MACLTTMLGIMGFSAVSAQAATWLEAGAVIGATKSVVGETDAETWLLDSTALGNTVIIHCNELIVKDGLLFANGTGLAELEFKNDCLFLFGGTALTECDPKEPIISKVKIEQYLHNSESYYLFSPDDGTLNFVTLHLDKNGPGCAIGESITVTGHVIAKECANEPLIDRLKHLIEPIFGTALDLAGPPAHKNSLKFGANIATLLGSEWLKMASGSTWAGHV